MFHLRPVAAENEDFLYRAYPKDWTVARKPKLGPPKVRGDCLRAGGLEGSLFYGHRELPSLLWLARFVFWLRRSSVLFVFVLVCVLFASIDRLVSLLLRSLAHLSCGTDASERPARPFSGTGTYGITARGYVPAISSPCLQEM